MKKILIGITVIIALATNAFPPTAEQIKNYQEIKELQRTIKGRGNKNKIIKLMNDNRDIEKKQKKTSKK